MGRRGEAPLAVVVLHAAPLGVRNQRQRARTAFAGGPAPFAGNHERQSPARPECICWRSLSGNQYSSAAILSVEYRRSCSSHRRYSVYRTVSPVPATSSISSSIPVVVSLCTIATMVIARVVLQDLFDLGRVRAELPPAVVRVAGDAHQLRHLNHTRHRRRCLRRSTLCPVRR